MKRKTLKWLQDGDSYLDPLGAKVRIGDDGMTLAGLTDCSDAELVARKLTPATRAAIRERKAAADITRIATGISPKLGELVGAMLQPAEPAPAFIGGELVEFKYHACEDRRPENVPDDGKWIQGRIIRIADSGKCWLITPLPTDTMRDTDSEFYEAQDIKPLAPQPGDLAVCRETGKGGYIGERPNGTMYFVLSRSAGPIVDATPERVAVVWRAK